MNAPERYQKEFDQLIREAEAKAEQVQNQERDKIWKGLQKSFDHLADIQKWPTEKRDAAKQYLLDHFWD